MGGVIRKIIGGWALGAAILLPLVAQGPAPRARADGASSESQIFAPIPKVSGPTPHLADGTPDLSGVWMGGGSNSGDITKALKPGDAVSMTPWA